MQMQENRIIRSHKAKFRASVRVDDVEFRQISLHDSLGVLREASCVGFVFSVC